MQALLGCAAAVQDLRLAFTGALIQGVASRCAHAHAKLRPRPLVQGQSRDASPAPAGQLEASALHPADSQSSSSAQGLPQGPSGYALPVSSWPCSGCRERGPGSHLLS